MISQLGQELLRFLLSSEEGFTDESIKQQFIGRYEQLAPAINELLSINRIQLFNHNDSLLYKAVKEETAIKFDGLGPEQILVYQAIERSGNKGIWTRDIKVLTNIPQHSLTKTLKILEQRLLIKSVRSVISKSKKLYMIYDTIPAKEITGGPWYSDQEFDHEFVHELGNFVVQIVKNVGMTDLNTIHDKVRISGISKVELSLEEVELVVNSLVYDYRLEEIQASVLLLTGHSSGKKMYKVCKTLGSGKNRQTLEYLSAVPCGVCPIISQCRDGGVVSPSSCQYYLQWLSSLDENTNSVSGDISFHW